MTTQKTVYYGVSDLPKEVGVAFDAAAAEVSRASQARGSGVVSETAAFTALLVAVDLQDAIIAGQAVAAARPGEERVERRGFHVPIELRDRIREAAQAKGVKIGAVGRLVLLARAGRLKETIETGLGGAPARLQAIEAVAAAAT
jgi:hypothetical protein